MQSDKNSENKKTAHLIKQICRDAASSRLKSYSKCENFEIAELDSNLKVYAHLMSMILIAGKALKITFKIHYGGNEAKSLASKLYGKPASELALSQATDFMGEYCNLTAGKIKKHLEDQNVSIGISLPLVTRGFDEVFFPKANDQTIFTDQWKFQLQDSKISCSVIIEIVDETKLKDIKATPSNQEEEGSVDFL